MKQVFEYKLDIVINGNNFFEYKLDICCWVAVISDIKLEATQVNVVALEFPFLHWRTSTRSPHYGQGLYSSVLISDSFQCQQGGTWD